MKFRSKAAKTPARLNTMETNLRLAARNIPDQATLVLALARIDPRQQQVMFEYMRPYLPFEAVMLDYGSGI